MNQFKYFIFPILLCSFLLSNSIQGYVRDSRNNKPLIGANVMLKENMMGISTDESGFYLIQDVPKGEYTLIVSYIGYDMYEATIIVKDELLFEYDIKLKIQAIKHNETTVTGTKRQQKITDAPATMEIISNRDIRRESTTNLGSYLKGLKGVDFTATGVDNYSISIRGFNSSFSTRLLTLTDGRVANLPALRVVNYSTIPQSSEDVESMEVVLGPATALYGANAHSGVVNITSKSPATSEGLNVNFSGSFDDRNMRKVDGRWAKKITNNLSIKVSSTYLDAYDWEYISETEWKAHHLPWVGTPNRRTDKKDNNPWRSYNAFGQDATFADTVQNIHGQWVRIGDGEPNHGDLDGDGVAGEDWYNGYDDDNDGEIDEDYFESDGIDNWEPFTDLNGNMTADLAEYFTDLPNGIWDAGEEFTDIGNNIWDTGEEFIDIGNGIYDEGEVCYGTYSDFDIDGDGYIDCVDDFFQDAAFEDIGNGIWDPGEEFIDIGNGIYDLGEPFIDIIGNGIWDPGEEFIDIGNGAYDSGENCLSATCIFAVEQGDPDLLILLISGTDFQDIGDGVWSDNEEYIDWNGNGEWDGQNQLIDEYIDLIQDQFIDGIDNNGNGRIDEREEGLIEHGLGPHWQYLLSELKIIIYNGRVPEYINGLPNPYFDSNNFDEYGNIIDPHVRGEYIWNEENYSIQFDNYLFDFGIDGIPGDPWIDMPGDGEFNLGESLIFGGGFLDCGLDGECQFLLTGEPNSNWPGYADEGEGDNIWQPGDRWIDVNQDGTPQSEIDNLDININESNYNDIWPPPNGIWDNAEIIHDCGTDGLCWDFTAPNQDIQVPSEIFQDLNENGIYDYENDEPFIDHNGNGVWDNALFIDLNSNGYQDEGESTIEIYHPDDGENDQILTAIDFGEGDGELDTGDGCFNCDGDYVSDFDIVNDTNGDGLDDFPDFSVRNRKIDVRIDYDLREDFNFSFNTGYSWTKTQQVTGIGRYLAEGWETTYYQISTRYQNWFFQAYSNRSNSGKTRGYNLGDVITDYSKDFAFQIQNNFRIREFLPFQTDIVWGVDYNRSMPETRGTILNDGPNKYDNDGDSYAYQNDGIDNNNNGLIDERGEPPLNGNDGIDNNNNGLIDETGEGVDEPDEWDDVDSDQIGLYYQTRTALTWDSRWELITATRLDYHSHIENLGLQFGPKIGVFYNPNDLTTWRFTFGRAFNTPSSTQLYTDFYLGENMFFQVYSKGNKDGTPYARVNLDIRNVETPIWNFPIDSLNNPNASSIECIESSGQWCSVQIGSYPFGDDYQERVDGAPYFYNYNPLNGTPGDMIPIDTSVYQIFIPEPNGEGVYYTPEETFNLPNVEPLKPEEIHSWELGYKGMISQKTLLTLDYYISHYLDFFSSASFITPVVVKRNTDEVIGFVPANEIGLQAPYGTAWDGIDNDGDFTQNFAMAAGWWDDKNGDCEYPEGHENFDPICYQEPGEWGFIDPITNTIYQPWEAFQMGLFNGVSMTASGDAVLDSLVKNWDAIGVDEYHPQTGLSEAETVYNLLQDSEGNPIPTPGRAYAPPQIILAQMNFGSVWMQGIDMGFTHFISENIILDGNFSWYNTTTYYNNLTKKRVPINAPKFKWNFSLKWGSPFGDIAFNYRHVDKFIWQDGLWSGDIGPYNIIDFHYNYSLTDNLKANISGLNIFNDVHRELVGGPKMGRQVIFRLTSSF